MATEPTTPLGPERPDRKASSEAPDEASIRRESSAEEFEQLRRLLLGKEQVDLEALRERFDSWNLTPEEVAEQLPAAIALSGSQDNQLGRALAPTLEAGISEAVHRNPQQIADAIYPILGPAIRRAISETIAGFVDTLNRAIDHSLSVRGLKWRFEAWRTGVPYGEIVLKYALVYQVEQAFLVHAESGLLLAHAAIDEKKSQDPDLVSGMLTAIKDFVGDSFDASREDGLRTFSVSDLTVMVETGPKAMLAAVVRGQAPATLVGRVNGTLETIHLQLRTELADFEGETEPFEAAMPSLEELLETVVATDQPETRSLAPKIAWAVAGVVLLVLVGFGVRSSMRWNSAREALRDEPGITLIDADRGWRRWSFEGLRDPLARDPASVIAELGFDPDRVEGRWEPYMSFDRQMVLARARRLLEPPSKVDLELMDSTLAVSGSASARWVREAQERVRGLPAVSDLDLSGLEITIPADLARARAELVSRRVLFAIGSAELSVESLSNLDAIAPELGQLTELATDLGYRVEVDIVGRTDSSGTEEGNRALSEQRSLAVLQALRDRGVSPDQVTASGVGVSDPLPGEDEDSQARLNRSTSFVVNLVGWDAGGDDSQ